MDRRRWMYHNPSAAVQQESGKGKNDAKRRIRSNAGYTFLVLFTGARHTRSIFGSLRQQFKQFRLWYGRHDSNSYQRSKSKYYSNEQWVWQIRQRGYDTDS